jgi:pilus assembly protein Flp/PilA
MNKLISSIRTFAIEEDGAQVVEYALIIAVVSIALVLLLSTLLGTNGAFNTFVTRVKNCLGTTTCS